MKEPLGHGHQGIFGPLMVPVNSRAAENTERGERIKDVEKEREETEGGYEDVRRNAKLKKKCIMICAYMHIRIHTLSHSLSYPGNFLVLCLKASPTGEKHRTTCRLLFTLLVKKSI